MLFAQAHCRGRFLLMQANTLFRWTPPRRPAEWISV
jgi:hypothetical protein